MAQHKQDLEKTLQSAWAHKEAGEKVAVTVTAIEALVGTGIDTAAIEENTDAKEKGRVIAATAQREFGKRIADAMSTLDKIIADESLTLVAEDTDLEGQHDQKLRKVLESATALKATGRRMADMVDLADKVVDELLVIYGVGGAKDNAGTKTNLDLVRAALDTIK